MFRLHVQRRWRAPRRIVVLASALAGAVAAGTLGIACSTSSTVSGPAALVHSIVLSPKSATLNPGATQDFTAQPLDASGKVVPGVTLSWASSNTGIVTVTQSGAVTAVAVGSAQIAASAYGINGLATVTVGAAPVASMVVAPASLTMRVSTSAHLTDTTKDASGNVLTGRTVTWSSDNTSVAAVDQTGLVTALAVGTAHVSATIPASTGQSKVSAQSIITVTLVPVAAVTITPNRPTVFVSQTTQLTAVPTDSVGDVLSGRAVTWQSLTPNLATVVASGITTTVTGVAAGSAVIQATCEGKIAVDTVTVLQPPPNSVEISPGAFTINVDGTVQGLTATVTNSLGQIVPGAAVNFRATNAAATITQTGNASANVAGVTVGTDTIVGTSGLVSGIAIAVVQAATVASVTITPNPASAAVGRNTTLTATLTDAKGNNITGKTLTWVTTAPSVVDFSGQTSVTGGQSQIVTGVGAGTATVSATSSDGPSGNTTVNVTDPVNHITVTPNPITVRQMYTVATTATAFDVNNVALTGIAFTYSTSGNASVNSSGVVTGVTPGADNLVVSAQGVNASDPVTVLADSVSTVTISGPTSTPWTTPITLTATLGDSAGHAPPGATVAWSSVPAGRVSPTSGASVTVTPQEGDTTNGISVTATSEGKSSGPYAITVTTVLATSVTVTPAPDSSTASGTPFTLTATAKNSGRDIPGRAITWSIDNPSLAGLSPTSGKSPSATTVTPGGTTGTTTIHAASSDAGATTGNVTFTVYPVDTIIPQNDTISVSGTNYPTSATITATVRNANGTFDNGTTSWSDGAAGTLLVFTPNPSSSGGSGNYTTVVTASPSLIGPPVTATATATGPHGQTGTTSVTVEP